MPNQHDIILTLDATKFTNAINQVQSLLEKMEKTANGIVISLQSAFDSVSLNNLNAQIQNASNTIAGIGGSSNKAAGGLNTASKSALTLDDNLDEIVKTLDQMGKGATKGVDAINKGAKTAAKQAEELEKRLKAVRDTKLFRAEDINKVETGLKSINETTKKAAANVLKIFETKAIKAEVSGLTKGMEGFGESIRKTKTFGDQMTQSLIIGLSHVVGAVAGTGANIFRSLSSEIPRNLGIGIFRHIVNLFSDSLRGVKTKLGEVGAEAKQTGEALAAAGGGGGRVTDAFNAAGGSAGGFGGILATLNTKLLGSSIILGLVGFGLDKLADKIFDIGQALNKTAGDFGLAFLQLGAVIDATEKRAGTSLGTMEEWKDSLVRISQVSGKSVADISQLASIFLEMDTAGELSAKGILELTETAAVLSPLFRNQTELVTNFRNALRGNFTAISGNIGTVKNAEEANKKYTQTLISQGKTVEEANRLAEKTSQIEKNRSAIVEAGRSRTDAVKESTADLNIAVNRLNGSLQALFATMGEGSAAIQARFLNVVVELIKGISSLPKPLLQSIGFITTLGGAGLNVAGKVLKLAAAIGVLSVAIAFLNKNIAVTIPLLGTSLAAALGKMAVSLGAPISQMTTFPATVGAGIKTIVSAIMTNFIPAIVAFIAKWSIIGVVILGVIAGFNKFADSIGGLSNAFQVLLSPMTAVLTSLNLFNGSLEISARLVAIYRAAIAGLALVFALAADRLLKLSQGIITLRRLISDSEDLKKKSKELEDQIRKNNEAFEILTKEMKLNALTAISSSAAIRALQGAYEGLFSAQSALKSEGLGLDAEQEKAFKRLKRALQDQIDQLKVRNTELTSGKAAAAQQKIALAIEKGIRDIEEASEGKALTEDQKIKIREALGGLEQQGLEISNNNELLERQNRIFKDIATQVQNLRINFNEQTKSIYDSVHAELQFRGILRTSNKDFDERIKDAELQKKLTQERFKIESQLQKAREELDKPRFEGDREVLPRDVLTPNQIKELENRIKDLEQQKINIEVAIRTQNASDELSKFLSDTQKQIDELGKKFNDEVNLSSQQISLARQFNKDLNLGIAIAERNLAVRQKALEVDREIETIRIRLASGKLPKEEFEQEKARLEALEKTREQILANFNAAQIQEETNKVKRSIIEITNSLEDQLKVIEARNQLFKEGVLFGDFNKIEEQISAVTSALESLIAKQIELQRLSQQGILIDEEEANKAIGLIGRMKEALKALNFVAVIQKSFNAIADSIQEAMTEGVRGVLQGTQTIKELFRNMASNILLSLANISAQAATDRLKQQFAEFAVDIAKSDIGRSIASAFGIDVDKLNLDEIFGTGKAATPQQQLKLAADSFKVSTDKFGMWVQKLIGGGGPIGGGRPVFDSGAIQETTLPTQAEETLFDISDNFEAGLDEFFNTADNTITSNLAEVSQTTNSGFTGFFQTIGEFIVNGTNTITDMAIKGFQVLFDSISQLMSSNTGGGLGDSSGGDWLSWFSDLWGSGSGFMSFGAAKGGLIPGRPSDEDDQLKPVASGEYVINSQAVQRYGTGIFDALNNMEMPESFYETMAANSAASQMSQPRAWPVAQQNMGGGGESQQPINVTIIDKSPKLDPKSFGLKEKDVIQIVVNGVRKDRVIRRVIRDDLQNGRV